jgi:serine/threonine protein kinase
MGRMSDTPLPEHLDQTRYQIRRILGRGMAGTVVLARDRRTDRDVAIKIITTTLKALLDRLGREVDLLRELRHEALVPLLDADLGRQPPYLVFPYYPGGDLTALVHQAPLPTERVLDIALRLAEGLAAIHRAGVIHRDIKPANVLLDGAGNPALADLGLGRAETSETLTATGTVMGTPRYIPPDVFNLGQAMDEASDQYALGATITELILGRPASWKIGDPLFPSEAFEAVPAGPLRTALRRANRSRAEHRFPSTDAFLEALSAEPAAPAPPPVSDDATATIALEDPDLPESMFPVTDEGSAPARGPHLLLPAALLVAALAAWGLRGRPPAPPPPLPSTPRASGSPFAMGARLVEGGAVRIELREPAQLRWASDEGWGPEASLGPLVVRLPPRLPAEMSLRWRQGDRQGTRHLDPAELLEPLLRLLTPEHRADLLREHVAGVSDGVEASLAAHRILLDAGPRLLEAPLPRELRARTVRALEEGEALAIALRRPQEPRIPPGQAGYRGVDTPRGQRPLLARVGPEEMRQPGESAGAAWGEDGETLSIWRLKPRRGYQRVLDAPWRDVEQRILWTWPNLEVPPGALVRVSVVYRGHPAPIRFRVGIDPRSDGASDSLARPGSEPGPAVLHLGTAHDVPAQVHSLRRLDGDVPATLLPPAGTPMELRLEELPLRQGPRPLVGYMDVHALEFRLVGPSPNQPGESN